MTNPQHSELDRPSLQAALLLLARDLTPEGSEIPRSVAEILERTGVSRSQAYEIRSKLHEVFPSLFNSAGRHPAPIPTFDDTSIVLAALRDYLMAHPGAATRKGARRFYSDGFRRFILDLMAPGKPGAALSVTGFAEVVGVPYDTLREWMRPPSTRSIQPANTPTVPPAPADSPVPARDEPAPPRP